MGCGCNKRRNKMAVTSVNQAERDLQQQGSKNALEVRMASLRAAIHNANSDAPVASEDQSD